LRGVEVLRLLLSPGGNPNTPNTMAMWPRDGKIPSVFGQSTTLATAALLGNHEAITVLLRSGANVNLINHARETQFSEAID
jgi:ankyrin repeat protein